VIESVIRSQLSDSGSELAGNCPFRGCRPSERLPRRDVRLPPDTDRRIVWRKLSKFLIESRFAPAPLRAPRLLKLKTARLESDVAYYLHFFLDTTVRKDYIHGALFFYSNFSVGLIVWTRFRPGSISGCVRRLHFGNRALWCFCKPTRRGRINHPASLHRNIGIQCETRRVRPSDNLTVTLTTVLRGVLSL